MAKRRKLSHDGADREDGGFVLEQPATILAKGVAIARALPGILTPATSQSEEPPRIARPRFRQSITADVETENEDPSDSSESVNTERRKYRELSHIVLEGPSFPRSLYQGWTPEVPEYTELEAVVRLRSLVRVKGNTPSNFAFFSLDDFSVYRPSSTWKHSHEMVSLERLTQDRFPELVFDGVLSVGDEKCFVRAVPFKILSLDGYGDSEITDMADHIYIQSSLAQKKDIWYKLGRSTTEYRRFHGPFLWLAQFTKHYVDYLQACGAYLNVTLQEFRKKFYQWLQSEYTEEDLASWLVQGPGTDFRCTVNAHASFLWNQCWNIDRAAGLCKHTVWNEIGPKHLTAIPEQPHRELLTVVTPFAFSCFQNMYFSKKLKMHRVTNGDILTAVRTRKQRLHLTPFLEDPVPATTATSVSTNPDLLRVDLGSVNVAPGDVVCVQPEAETKWRGHNVGDCWYAYVQRVRSEGDRTKLDVLWLYKTTDTTLGKAQYPFQNELFLSDNCSCGKEALDSACVLGKARVSWFARNPYEEHGLFVRQVFRTVHDNDTYDFVALAETDFACYCDRYTPIFEECRGKYTVGDMVLVRDWHEELRDDRLEPMQIVQFDLRKKTVWLRRFLRRSEMDISTDARPNELVATSKMCEKLPSKVIRKCHVRTFSHYQIATGDIVTPYDRDGTGDFYFLASEDGRLPPLDSPYPHGVTDEDPVDDRVDNSAVPDVPLNVGWNPLSSAAKPKLRGMGIFCGGGTFDRGLEEGGAVKFRYAVDWASHALHSYRANLTHPEKVKFFLGSVNDYLARAMLGDPSGCIAHPGPDGPQFMSAGSPCPGFSNMQNDKNSEQSKQNASMVASVVSFVDFYVPEYLVLENVVTMTAGMGVKKDQNVFAQIVASLVAMGYQVQQFLMDAWSHGSSQSRTRVFIVASAPGLASFPQMPLTHAHPTDTTLRIRSLGKSSNGLPFGVRREEFTPFQHVSPREVTKDLPYIGDALPHICTQFPDHRTPVDEAVASKARMAAVPTYPHGLGLRQAQDLGVLRGEPLEHCSRVNAVRSNKNSRMYARVYPDRLFPTVITKLSVGDGIAGRALHWTENRVLTVLEAKRTQGYLDSEVIVGDPVMQFKIIGNSVDRKVALTLGLALRASWMDHDLDKDVARLGNVAAEPQHPAEHYGFMNEQDTQTSPVALEDRETIASDNDDQISHIGGAIPEDEPLDARDAASEDDDVLDNSDIADDVARFVQKAAEDSEDELANDVDLAVIRDMDNRAAKIALNLSAEERREVRDHQFKGIRKILDSRMLEKKP